MNIFAASYGVYHSIDNGETWTKVDIDQIGSYITSLAFNAAEYIFAATDNGLFRSSDNGETWSPVKAGLANVYLVSLTVGSRGRMWAGSWSEVVRLSRPNLSLF